MFSKTGIAAVLALVSAASFATAKLDSKAAADQKTSAQPQVSQTAKSADAGTTLAKESHGKKKHQKKIGF